MAINLKSKVEITIMRQAGHLLAQVMKKLEDAALPGITTLEIDKLADDLITKTGGFPCFKKVRDYKWATCLCVNEVVVHGIPGDYELKPGDIFGIDIGMIYNGFNSDMSESIIIPGLDDKELVFKNKFLAAGKLALEKAINQAKVGNRIGHISRAIQETIEAAGYFGVKSLVGHGIGKDLHEDPHIPVILKGTIEETFPIEEGLVIAIEVIYNQGTPEIVYKNNDGWTISTGDNQLSGLFERTVAVLSEGPEVLTKIV